jgi:stage II sporulation protein AB (anti-sigma F factor)
MQDQKIHNSVVITMLSKAENVALARSMVAVLAAQMDITVNQLEELKVAVSEAVSNAVIHGYQGNEDKLVEIRAELLTDGIAVTIEDRGIGIADISQAMQPSYSSDPERMGLGFAFMKSFTDKLEVESQPGKGTRIYLFKQIRDVKNQQQQL